MGLSLNYLEINNDPFSRLHCFPSSSILLCLQINGVPSLRYLPNLTIACRRFALTTIPWHQSTQDPHDTFVSALITPRSIMVDTEASPFSFIVDPFVPPNQWRPISVLSPESHHSMSTFCIDDDSMESINSGPSQ